MPPLSARFKSTVVSFIGFIWLFSLPIASNISEVLAQANDPRSDPRSAPRVYKYEAPEVWQESVIDLPTLSQKVASVNIRQEVKLDLIFMSTCLRSLMRRMVWCV